MERQEEEAIRERREAARRRTRDLLLERAKQRLLNIAAAAAASTAGTSSSSNSNLSSNAAESSGQLQTSSGAEGGEVDGRGQCSLRRGEGQQCAAARKVATAATSCEGGEGAAPAMAMTAPPAGTPLYAQETWAARHNKVHLMHWTQSTLYSTDFRGSSVQPLVIATLVTFANKQCGLKPEPILFLRVVTLGLAFPPSHGTGGAQGKQGISHARAEGEGRKGIVV